MIHSSLKSEVPPTFTNMSLWDWWALVMWWLGKFDYSDAVEHYLRDSTLNLSPSKGGVKHNYPNGVQLPQYVHFLTEMNPGNEE